MTRKNSKCRAPPIAAERGRFRATTRAHTVILEIATGGAVTKAYQSLRPLRRRYSAGKPGRTSAPRLRRIDLLHSVPSMATALQK